MVKNRRFCKVLFGLLLILLVFFSVSRETQAAQGLTVTYLDVGQGDAAVLECDGHYMMIDGGDSSQSSMIYSYLRDHQITHLDYIIATHPHDDHIGGLSGALNYVSADRIFSPLTEYDSKTFESLKKYASKQGKRIEIPDLNREYSFGEGTFRVLGPVAESSDLNDMSLVVRIEYGETSFLFTGDMGLEEENSILDAGDVEEATVLKVGHHGSDRSTGYHFLRTVHPQYAVISVGRENPYGHPSESTLSKLNDAEAEVYRTDLYGNIEIHSDGQFISIKTENKEPKAELAGYAAGEASAASRMMPDPQENDFYYVLNKNTLKFHYPECSSVRKMKEKNKEISHDSREELIQKGYSPCGNCKP